MSFVGIFNENESYPDHYLTEILDDDSGGVLDAWFGNEAVVLSRRKGNGEPRTDNQNCRAQNPTRRSRLTHIHVSRSHLPPRQWRRPLLDWSVFEQG